ncbi:MAG: hypothetical protein NTW30_01300, partial [Candidatus Aenigmarchaeota archaeon]|nr:hypothetical protein [Candidatus Aenigmarchaeota archaeon]
MARSNCPKCGSPLVSGQGTDWVCRSCDNRWPQQVDTSGFFQKTAEDAGKTEWGRGATEKTPASAPTPPSATPSPPSPPPATPSPPSPPPATSGSDGGGDYRWCKKCGRRYGKDAKNCPYCGYGSISGKIECKVKGKVTEIGTTFTFNIFDAIKFSIITALLIVVTTNFLVPKLQEIFPFTVPSWFNVLFIQQGLWFIVG